MKTLPVILSLALVGVNSIQAQIFRPSVGSGAVVGAVAGGLIGGHNGDRWAQGAVIGAAAGALIGAALTPQEPVYQAPPVYPSTTTVIDGQPTTVIQTAPTVPDAPMVSSAPVVVTSPAPQVVYVERAPRVVYVPAPPPRVIYAAPTVVRFGFGYHSSPRYRGYDRHHDYGHRHHGHHDRGHGHRR